MSRPWIKIHVECLDNPKVATLSLALRGIWFTTLLIAERFDRAGLLPSADRFSLMAHTDEETVEKAFIALVKKGLIEETPDGMRVHDWQDWQARKPSDEPDAILARVHKHRGVTPRNALQNVTESVTPRNARNALESKRESERENRGEEKEIPPTPSEGDAAKPRNVRALKTPIPDPFLITDAMLAWAESKGYDTPFIEDASEYFVRWAKMHDHRYADWGRAWMQVMDSKWKERGSVRQIRKG